jgi:hypothetical protein
MLTTPNRGYSYPEYTDPANFPTQIQDLATDVDLDVTNNLDVALDEALDQPSCRVFRDVGTQIIPAGANTTLTYSAVPTYDNNLFFDFAISPSNVVVRTPGVYLMTGSVNLAPSGAAGGAAALIMASTGGVIANPVGVSRNLDDNQTTSLSCTTLHNVGTVPETITMFVRHNHGASLNASFAQLSLTRIS